MWFSLRTRSLVLRSAESWRCWQVSTCKLSGKVRLSMFVSSTVSRGPWGRLGRAPLAFWCHDQEGILQPRNFLLVRAQDVIFHVGDRDEMDLKWSFHQSFFWTASQRVPAGEGDVELIQKGQWGFLRRKDATVWIDRCEPFGQNKPANRLPLGSAQLD